MTFSSPFLLGAALLVGCGQGSDDPSHDAGPADAASQPTADAAPDGAPPDAEPFSGPAVNGRIVDRGGRGLAGVAVAITDPPGAVTLTDAEGRFRFEHAPYPYTLAAVEHEAEGGTFVHVLVDVHRADPTLRFAIDVPDDDHSTVLAFDAQLTAPFLSDDILDFLAVSDSADSVSRLGVHYGFPGSQTQATITVPATWSGATSSQTDVLAYDYRNGAYFSGTFPVLANVPGHFPMVLTPSGSGTVRLASSAQSTWLTTLRGPGRTRLGFGQYHGRAPEVRVPADPALSLEVLTSTETWAYEQIGLHPGDSVDAEEVPPPHILSPAAESTIHVGDRVTWAASDVGLHALWLGDGLEHHLDVGIWTDSASAVIPDLSLLGISLGLGDRGLVVSARSDLIDVDELAGGTAPWVRPGRDYPYWEPPTARVRCVVRSPGVHVRVQ